ncbi:unnamed protein product [Ixodes persulcatus]
MSTLLSPRHPDFVPSIFVCKDEFKKRDALDRYHRFAGRSKKKNHAPQLGMAGRTNKCKKQVHANASLLGRRSHSQCCLLWNLHAGAVDLAQDEAALATQQPMNEELPMEDAQATCDLLVENMALRKIIQDLEGKCKRLERRTFTVDTIHPTSFKFYTELQSKANFDALSRHFEMNAQRMIYWDGGKSEPLQRTKERTLSKSESSSWFCTA